MRDRGSKNFVIKATRACHKIYSLVRNVSHSLKENGKLQDRGGKGANTPTFGDD